MPTRRRHVAAAVLAGLGTAALLATTTPLPADATADGPTPSSQGSTMPAARSATPAEHLDHEIKVRTAFGLDASPAHIGRVHADPDSRVAEIAIPLSPSEVRRLVRHDHDLRYADTVTAAASHVPQFVGARFDRFDLVIEVVAPSDRAAAAIARPLRRLVPARIHVRVLAVEYSAAAVQAVQDRLDDLPAADFARLHIVSGGQDPEGQHVTIGIARDAPAGTEQQVRAVFPEPIAVIERTDPVDFQRAEPTT